MAALSGSVDPDTLAVTGRGLTTNRHLTNLDLRDCSIADGDGLAVMASMLQVNGVLQTIDLRMNQVGDLGGQALMQVLPVGGEAAPGAEGPPMAVNGKPPAKIKYIHISERMNKPLFDGIYAALARNRGGGKKGKGKGTACVCISSVIEKPCTA